MSVNELAQRAGVSGSTLNYMLQGSGNPGLNQFMQVLGVLGARLEISDQAVRTAVSPEWENKFWIWNHDQLHEQWKGSVHGYVQSWLPELQREGWEVVTVSDNLPYSMTVWAKRKV